MNQSNIANKPDGQTATSVATSKMIEQQRYQQKKAQNPQSKTSIPNDSRLEVKKVKTNSSKRSRNNKRGKKDQSKLESSSNSNSNSSSFLDNYIVKIFNEPCFYNNDIFNSSTTSTTTTTTTTNTNNSSTSSSYMMVNMSTYFYFYLGLFFVLVMLLLCSYCFYS